MSASPKEFGAVGDGVIDDTAAINQCLAARRAVDFGGPGNTYLITGAVLVAQAATQVLTGAGATLRGTVRLRNAAHRLTNLIVDGGIVVEPTATQTRVERCTVTGGAIAIGAHHTRVHACRGKVTVTGANYTAIGGSVLSALEITDGEGFAVRGNTIGGISVRNGRGGRIQQNSVDGNGIDLRGCSALTVTGNSITGGETGVFVGDTATTSITIGHNTFKHQTIGVRVESAVDGALIAGVVVKGNTIAAPAEGGILVSESGGAQVAGITVSDNDVHLAGSGRYGIQVAGAECSRIAGNRVYRPTGPAIKLTGTDLIRVTGNFLRDASYTTGQTADAIAVDTSNRALIRDNTVYGSARYAVAIGELLADGTSPTIANTVSGTRWRSAGGLAPGDIAAGLLKSQLYDNVTTNFEDPAAVRIMPLGDSITDGYGFPGGYRVDLWSKLVAGGYRATFVGSLANGPNGLGGPAGLGDRDHEGHTGFTIGQIDERIGLWLPSAQPQVVLLHIGTNDVGVQPDGIAARLGALIDRVVAAAPAAHVFVAQITPVLNAARELTTAQYNAAIPAIVSARAAAGKRVYLVNMHDALNASTDLQDGTHPNAQGYAKMAAVWYDAMRSRTGVLTT